MAVRARPLISGAFGQAPMARSHAVTTALAALLCFFNAASAAASLAALFSAAVSRAALFRYYGS